MADLQTEPQCVTAEQVKHMTNITPILIVNTQASTPVAVAEQLRVYENGRSYLHIQAAADPQRRNQAGTYVVQLDGTLLQEVQNMVEGLLALSPQSGDAFPGGVKSTITVSDGKRSQSHLLPARFVASASPALMRAATVASDVMVAAFANPLAAVRLSAKAKPASGQSASLLLTCASIGTEPVIFLFRPESFVVRAESTEIAVPIWQSSGATTGLIDGQGNLVDGVYVPATMIPGSTATAVYTQVIPTIQPDVQVQLEGWIELQGPERETAVMPQEPFWLRSEVTLQQV